MDAGGGRGMGRADLGASYHQAACDLGPVPFPWSPGAPQVQPLPAPPQQPSSRAPWHPQALLDFSAALHEDDTALSQTQATAPTRAASVSAQLLGPQDRSGVRLGSTRPAGLRVGQGGRGAPPAQGTGLGGSRCLPGRGGGGGQCHAEAGPPTGLRRPHSPRATPHGRAQAPWVLFLRRRLGIQR